MLPCLLRCAAWCEPVITQQINFYQDRFRARRLWISALQVAAALLVVIAAGAIWSFLLHTEFDQARRSNLAIKADRDRMTAELAVANADLSKLLEDHRLDREIETTARQISARGGELICEARGGRVEIAGRAVIYLEGTITV